MSLQVYNTLSRQMEAFEPVREGFVGVYVCGPTVYDDAHIGHGKTYVNFDIVVRYLRYKGYNVRYVQNITDVGHILDSGEDRIMRGAERERLEPMELVEKYTRRYFADMDALNITRPDISPRASGHIPEQIELVETLIEKHHAYETEGTVYFDVPSWPDYGKLSGRKVEDLMEGTREEVRQEKRHPADFALWKKATPEHIMQWPSPWGRGYPGWHAECTAMATKYLGQPFDFHAGGMENKFPHHECEIAQAEAATGQPFAKYWLHNGMLMIKGEEMHKSLGNFVTLRDAINKFGAMAIRLFILSAHYRSPLDFTAAGMQAAQSGLARLHDVMREIQWHLERGAEGEASDAITQMLEEHLRRFEEAMDDDFGTPQALAVLFELTREVNSLLGDQELTQGDLEAIRQLYLQLGGDVLGLTLDQVPGSDSGNVLDGLVGLLIEQRQKYRAERNWAEADAIRDRLAATGIELKDGQEGTRWSLTRG